MDILRICSTLHLSLTTAQSFLLLKQAGPAGEPRGIAENPG